MAAMTEAIRATTDEIEGGQGRSAAESQHGVVKGVRARIRDQRNQNREGREKAHGAVARGASPEWPALRGPPRGSSAAASGRSRREWRLIRRSRASR
jgi:hypothetical protein